MRVKYWEGPCAFMASASPICTLGGGGGHLGNGMWCGVYGRNGLLD